MATKAAAIIETDTSRMACSCRCGSYDSARKDGSSDANVEMSAGGQSVASMAKLDGRASKDASRRGVLGETKYDDMSQTMERGSPSHAL